MRQWPNIRFEDEVDNEKLSSSGKRGVFRLSSRHHFNDRGEPDGVAHTLVISGVLGNYTNSMAEPVFQKPKVSQSLTLDVAVTASSISQRSELRVSPDVRFDG